MSDRSDASEALVVLRRRIDAHFDAARERSGLAMQCGAGCDKCCHVRLTVFALEAEPIARALARMSREDPELRARIRAQATDPRWADKCPFLIDGCCSVYAERPVICRSHGLPIAVENEEGDLEVENCELNFRDAPPDPKSILRLDAVNQPLSVMVRMWDRSGGRIALEDLAAVDED